MKLRSLLQIILITLAVLRTEVPCPALTVLTYNLAGNGVEDWSTNSAQVRAIGRQMMFLQPDVITFQEVPFTQSHEMTNFVKAFLPGYFLARDSGTDGFIRSAILSRYPIRRAQKWLDGASLTNFGVEARFARDLYEAEIQAPGFDEPLHVFTTHLKASGDSASAERRAAEASAISNFFVTVFLPTLGGRPYLLTGDMNEDIVRPPSSSRQPLQRLLNAATGLHLLTPVDPFTQDERTYSGRTRLTTRFDYILPGGRLASNVLGSVLFRTDNLTPLPGGLNKDDTSIASDHLPVLVEFRSPSEPPLQLTLRRTESGATQLDWQSVAERRYALETTLDFVKWTEVLPPIIATANRSSLEVGSFGTTRMFRVREFTVLP